MFPSNLKLSESYVTCKRSVYIIFFFLQVVRNETGNCSETMRLKSWDVQNFIGQRARVRLVDNSSEGWGHINYDLLGGDINCEEEKT